MSRQSNYILYKKLNFMVDKIFLYQFNIKLYELERNFRSS